MSDDENEFFGGGGGLVRLVTYDQITPSGIRTEFKNPSSLYIDSIEPIKSKCKITDQGEIENQFLLEVIFDDKPITIDITDAIMSAIIKELKEGG